MTTTHKTLRGPRGAVLMVTEKGLKKDPELGKKIDKGVFPGIQGGPHENQIAGIAVAMGDCKSKMYKQYVEQVVKNAKVLSDELLSLDYNLVTGGTDNHLIVLDLRNKDMSGKVAADALEEVGLVVNANAIPHDPAPPGNPSGIRIGTPAITTRGMKEMEMIQIAKIINLVLSNRLSVENKLKAKKEVLELCKRFPLPE